MEKYLVALLLIVSSTVYAQQSNLPVYCINYNSLDSTLSEWDEIPFVRGKSFRENSSGEIRNALVLFVNANKRTWTLVEKFSDDKYCVLAAGTDFEPVPAKIIDDVINEREKSKS